jgi:hypothetical protein
MKKKRTGRRRAERAAREPRAARPRSAAHEIEQLAPWRAWKPVELRASPGTGKYRVQFAVSKLSPEKNARYSDLITSAAQKHFKIEEVPREGEGPAAYLVGRGRLRVVYNELVVRFARRLTAAQCGAILAERGFRQIVPSPLVKNQWIVRPARPGIAGKALLEAADGFRRFKKEVLYAWPNSVAEYVRASGVAPKTRRWWLDTMGVNSPPGKRDLPDGKASIRVAVLDDGVDIVHPNLSSRVVAGLGRDFAVAANHPDRNNPMPKVKAATTADSDYHGTACAGLICSDGSENMFKGVAPGCKLVPVRVIDGADLIVESSVAEAIRYATDVADVISCSWVGDEHSDVVAALDETAQGRNGKGVPIFCAAGNDGIDVDFPARHACAIAVGACDHDGRPTVYSNLGDRLDVVAPSSNGTSVYTTDVSKSGWGFTTGRFYGSFGATSAATAIAAGVGALCLSANDKLTAKKLRSLLQDTAVKIVGKPSDNVVYDASGHSQKFGYGRIDAAKAVSAA